MAASSLDMASIGPTKPSLWKLAPTLLYLRIKCQMQEIHQRYDVYQDSTGSSFVIRHFAHAQIRDDKAR